MKGKIFDSQFKILPLNDKLPRELHCAEFFLNEPYSFQLAVRSEDGEGAKPISVSVEGFPGQVSVYKQGFVPVLHINGDRFEKNAEMLRPGLFPDMLLKRRANAKIIKNYSSYSKEPKYVEEKEKNAIISVPDSWQGLWITLNEEGKNISPGRYNVTVRMIDLDTDTPILEKTVTAAVLPAALPEQKTIYTNWFHCDCLCDIYHVRPFSARFWDILEKYFRNAALYGQNMILLPAFTPALDTWIGKERKTVQLVDIGYENGHFSFDFSKLKKYIGLAKKCGIRYFEHAHLFTQWGAGHAPKILVTVGKTKKRMFGWETDASSPCYTEFLTQYLRAFGEFVNENGIGDRVMFHVSDEPSVQCEESYRRAVETVRDQLKNYMCGDALGSYIYYENGMVKTPIVIADKVPEFEGRCDNFWMYYTGNPSSGEAANRLVNNAAARCRILGIKIYCSGAKGFLEWGYNYYYGRMSEGIANPCSDPSYYKMYPGVAFLVYPAADGTPIPSIREKLMNEALCDVRTLQLLESLVGREQTLKVCEEYFCGPVRPDTYIKRYDDLLTFRKRVNRLILQEMKTSHG